MSSLPRSELVDHPLDLARLWSGGFLPEQLQSVEILGFEGFFPCFDYHTTLDPHLDTFCWWQIGAFRDKA